nr:class I histocompatibility antigen, F10 alpha chain-like [Nerophis lumbriciformis]
MGLKVTNIFLFRADIMNLFLFFLLVVQMHSVTPVIHTLQYFYTASSQVPNFPEYVIVGYVDGVEISYYDSNIRKAESKQDWMNKITAEDPKYWQRQTEISVRNELIAKHNLEVRKKRFNQTGGVHIDQWMYGCEWNDETDEVKGWDQRGYDGEDYISLDMKTWTFTAAKPQAFPDKLKWDQNIFILDYQKYYYTERCPSYLKKYVKNGKKVLMRTELPEVFLLQKTPSSPVTCMATGFYPDLADLFWRKDGEQIFEDVEHGELLPNHDGTFQMSVELKVEVTAEVEGKYECVFQLSGVKEDLVTKLERRSILSNASHEDNWSVALAATAAVVAVAAVLAAIIIVMVRRHRNRQGEGHQCPPSSSSSSSRSRP